VSRIQNLTRRGKSKGGSGHLLVEEVKKEEKGEPERLFNRRGLMSAQRGGGKKNTHKDNHAIARHPTWRTSASARGGSTARGLEKRYAKNTTCGKKAKKKDKICHASGGKIALSKQPK